MFIHVVSVLCLVLSVWCTCLCARALRAESSSATGTPAHQHTGVWLPGSLAQDVGTGDVPEAPMGCPQAGCAGRRQSAGVGTCRPCAVAGRWCWTAAAHASQNGRCRCPSCRCRGHVGRHIRSIVDSRAHTSRPLSSEQEQRRYQARRKPETQRNHSSAM